MSRRTPPQEDPGAGDLRLVGRPLPTCPGTVPGQGTLCPGGGAPTPVPVDAVARSRAHPGTLWRFPSFGSHLSWSTLAKTHRRTVFQSHEHWEVMLQEIADDVAKNRMTGPYQGPPEWKKKTVAAPQFAHCNHLLPRPEAHQATAVAFSILQTGSDGRQKVRRGEDWKRGGPVNHRAGTFLASAAAVAAKGHTPVLWGTDQEDAYRQLPLKDPSEAWMILFTKAGPTLWRRNALLFGSTASVWAYGRTADLLCWVARCFLMVSAIHFVDDFASLEATETAQSAFKFTHQLWEELGFRFKDSKKQPPASSHRIQGILMSCSNQEFTFTPHPPRMQRTCTRILEILQENAIEPDETAKLAGKIQFLSETLIGQAVKSCLMPLYRRAYTTAKAELSDGLRDSLRTLHYLLGQLSPKIFKFDYKAPAIIYANAYFQSGDRKIRLTEAKPEDIDADATNLYKNGWGFVAKLPNGQTVYANGEIPADMVGALTSHRAFIYGLEILGQMIPLILLQNQLPETVWCWCDNTASESALRKGYGKDPKINALLAAFWTFLATIGVEPHWRRVCSSANISDGISREDETLAKEFEWIQVAGPLHTIYKTLLKCTKDLHTALRMGPALQSLAGQWHGCSSMDVGCRTAMEKQAGQASETSDGPGSDASKKWEDAPCCLHDWVWSRWNVLKRNLQDCV